MAGIARATQLLFSTTGLTPTGGFGAASGGDVATEVATSNTPANIQSGAFSVYGAGWNAACLGSSKFMPIEDRNALDYLFSYQISYVLERGIAEYDAGTTYNIGDITRQAATGNIYLSLINANTGNALSNGSDWQYCGNITQLLQASYWCGTSGGSANVQTLTTGFSLSALTAGQSFEFIAGFTSTTSTMTFTIDSVAAKEAFENSASGLIPVPASGIIAGNVYKAKWDGAALVVNATVGSYSLPAATTSTLGGVIPDGTIITVDGSGDITVVKGSSSAFGVVKVDNTTITSSGGVLSAIQQTGLGTPVSRSISTTYQAATDGFFYGSFNTEANGTIYVDTNSTPSTIALYTDAYLGSTGGAWSVPVPAGYYYKVTGSNSLATCFWVPLGV